MDGQSGKVGTNNFKERDTFEPAKKIDTIECIFDRGETSIIRINF